jgi:hypothetical protein
LPAAAVAGGAEDPDRRGAMPAPRIFQGRRPRDRRSHVERSLRATYTSYIACSGPHRLRLARRPSRNHHGLARSRADARVPVPDAAVSDRERVDLAGSATAALASRVGQRRRDLERRPNPRRFARQTALGPARQSASSSSSSRWGMRGRHSPGSGRRITAPGLSRPHRRASCSRRGAELPLRSEYRQHLIAMGPRPRSAASFKQASVQSRAAERSIHRTHDAGSRRTLCLNCQTARP